MVVIPEKLVIAGSAEETLGIIIRTSPYLFDDVLRIRVLQQVR